MMTPEAKHALEIQDEHEFLDKMGDLVVEYRHKMRLGCMVGALETLKLRLFIETCKEMDRKEEEEK